MLRCRQPSSHAIAERTAVTLYAGGRKGRTISICGAPPGVPVPASPFSSHWDRAWVSFFLFMREHWIPDVLNQLLENQVWNSDFICVVEKHMPLRFTYTEAHGKGLRT